MYYFLKKLIFFYKIMFSSNEEIDVGRGRTSAVFALGGSQCYRADGGHQAAPPCCPPVQAQLLQNVTQ